MEKSSGLHEQVIDRFGVIESLNQSCISLILLGLFCFASVKIAGFGSISAVFHAAPPTAVVAARIIEQPSASPVILANPYPVHILRCEQVNCGMGNWP